jgi:uncharacterized protein
MMLDMDTLKELPTRLVLEEDASQLNLSNEGMTVKGKARAEMNIMPGDHVYFCNGLATCEAEILCSRCLELYNGTLCGEIEFSMQEVVDGRELKPDELPENELIVLANETEIDITAPVREALLLALPLKPLCRTDCRGLCPMCGVNRNEHLCDCKIEKTDSRWDGLRDLLK